MLEKFQKFVRSTVGTVAIGFAVMAPVVVGGMGMGLDMARAHLIKERLGNALDASALAAAAGASDENLIRQKVVDFFEVNFPAEELGITFTPEVSVVGDEITVYGRATYSTMFMHLLGISEIDVESETVVQRQVQGIEAVLVMDNTGSMSRNNNIATLREAATNFVNILFAATEDPEFIRIGLVPYSTSVNVGNYGLGYDLDGSYYDAAFVNNPNNWSYSPNSSSQWGGCVLAADYPDDTVDHEGPWDIYRYCRRDSDDYPVCDRRWSSSQNTHIARRSPNYICPRTSVVPLSNDQDLLLESIDDMQARGWTLGNYGLAWGHRLISPEYPFTEGAAWDSLYWRKAVIMMTDGVNTMHRNYTAYGPTQDHNISPTDLNERFAEVCENLKAQGVTIYTVTFTGGVSESTKQYYKDCASSLDQYYDAPDQSDLIDAFENISRELSNLHIKS